MWPGNIRGLNLQPQAEMPACRNVHLKLVWNRKVGRLSCIICKENKLSLADEIFISVVPLPTKRVTNVLSTINGCGQRSNFDRSLERLSGLCSIQFHVHCLTKTILLTCATTQSFLSARVVLFLLKSRPLSGSDNGVGGTVKCENELCCACSWANPTMVAVGKTSYIINNAN